MTPQSDKHAHHGGTNAQKVTSARNSPIYTPMHLAHTGN